MSSYDPFGDPSSAHKRPREDPDASNPTREGTHPVAGGPQPSPDTNSAPQQPSEGPRGVSLRADTILGRPAPVDDRTASLARFLAVYGSREGVEVESKLGLLLDKRKGTRASLDAVGTEAVIREEAASAVRFKSEVEVRTFQTLNKALNARVQASGGKIVYKRTRASDLGFDDRVRVSRAWDKESDTFASVADSRVQTKKKLGDWNLLAAYPVPLDIRVSASEEINLPRSEVAGKPARRERLKDRLSYEYGILSVDITTVMTYERIDPKTYERQCEPEVTYEVELELLPAAEIAEACKLSKTGDWRKLESIAQELLDNSRALVAEISRHSR